MENGFHTPLLAVMPSDAALKQVTVALGPES
jgi:hypothetical protein